MKEQILFLLANITGQIVLSWIATKLAVKLGVRQAIKEVRAEREEEK